MKARLASPISLRGLLALSACVLPGPLMMTERYEVQGRLLDAQGQPVTGKPVVLVQPQRDKTATKKMAAALAEQTQLHGTIRGTINVTTDSHGQFAQELSAFRGCHPIWLFPPLFDLPCRMRGAEHYGRFFLLQSPGTPNRIYQVEVRHPKPRVRIVDCASGGFRRLRRGEESVTGVTVRTQRVFQTANSPPRTNTLSLVRLAIASPRIRE